MKKFFNLPNFGLLIIRFILGGAMIAYGIPIFMGGKSSMAAIGGSMAIIGITFAPLFWGFMAALSYVLGGTLYILGFFFRPVCLILVFDMVMATLFHIHNGDAFSKISHPIELGCVFLGLLFIGAGKYSIDKE